MRQTTQWSKEKAPTENIHIHIIILPSLRRKFTDRVITSNKFTKTNYYSFIVLFLSIF
jgi:hypothetical protein